MRMCVTTEPSLIPRLSPRSDEKYIRFFYFSLEPGNEARQNYLPHLLRLSHFNDFTSHCAAFVVTPVARSVCMDHSRPFPTWWTNSVLWRYPSSVIQQVFTFTTDQLLSLFLGNVRHWQASRSAVLRLLLLDPAFTCTLRSYVTRCPEFINVRSPSIPLTRLMPTSPLTRRFDIVHVGDSASQWQK